MCPMRCVHRKKRPIRMTILPVNGAHDRRKTHDLMCWSAAAAENGCQLLRRNHFELGKRTVARLLVRTPPSKLGRVAEPVALHVVVSNLHHQLGTYWLP